MAVTIMTAPLHRRSLSAESWDALFDFLDPARSGKQGESRDAEAEDKFLEITRKLVYFFAGRGCSDAEDLAAETMLRVAGKCAELSGAGFADRIAYFYGVARNVRFERLRETRRELTNRESAAKDPTLFPVADAEHRQNEDEEHRCLEKCMARLSSGARRLILDYYGGDNATIASHRELAAQVGKSLNALRIDVHRIRNTLRQCVFECTHPPVARIVGP
jgi:RNA polymerase sigma factor (sigma-70 family)